jgi:hypothetical protein
VIGEVHVDRELRAVAGGQVAVAGGDGVGRGLGVVPGRIGMVVGVGDGQAPHRGAVAADLVAGAGLDLAEEEGAGPVGDAGRHLVVVGVEQVDLVTRGQAGDVHLVDAAPGCERAGGGRHALQDRHRGHEQADSNDDSTQQRVPLGPRPTKPSITSASASSVAHGSGPGRLVSTRGP